jgi:hypothetical protein
MFADNLTRRENVNKQEQMKPPTKTTNSAVTSTSTPTAEPKHVTFGNDLKHQFQSPHQLALFQHHRLPKPKNSSASSKPASAAPAPAPRQFSRAEAAVAKDASAHSASVPQQHLQSQASIAKPTSVHPASAPLTRSQSQTSIVKPTIAGPAFLPHSAKRPFAESDDDDDTANRPHKKSRHFPDIHSRSYESDESSDDTDYGSTGGLKEDGRHGEEPMADDSFVGFPDDEDEENSTLVIDRQECPANFYFTTNQLALCPMEFELDEDAREHVQKFRAYIPAGQTFCKCARTGYDKDDCCLQNGCTWFFASNDEGFFDRGWAPGASTDMAYNNFDDPPEWFERMLNFTMLRSNTCSGSLR